MTETKAASVPVRVGVDVSALQELARRATYLEHRIPKRGGGERLILEPEPELMHVQRQLLAFFSATLATHRCATGRKGPIYNARQHAGAKVIVCFDVEDFFGSITREMVVQTFREHYDPQATEIFADLVCHKGSLPAGAPTSMIVADAVCYPVDAELASWLPSYTRFVDDITISRAVHISQPQRQYCERRIQRVLQSWGLRLNSDKTRYATTAEPMYVTGLLVNPDPRRPSVRAPRSAWRQLRSDVKRLERKAFAGEKSDERHMQRVMGFAAYLGQTDPVRAAPYKERLQALFKMRSRL